MAVIVTRAASWPCCTLHVCFISLRRLRVFNPSTKMRAARSLAYRTNAQMCTLRYNVVFLLADGGALNYAGTLHWLEQIDAQLASAIEVVICLDSLASASETEPLYLHTSRPEKDPVAKRLYDVCVLISISTTLMTTETKLI